MLRLVHSSNLPINKYYATVVELVMYCSCFTWSNKQENYFYNASMHSCSRIRIVCLFRLTCTGFRALTWSWSSSWHSWVKTLWKDVTGIQECQMLTQLVTSERPSNIKQFKALHEWFTLSFTPPAVKAGGVQWTLKYCHWNLTLQSLLFYSQVFIHHDQPCLKLRNPFKAILLHHAMVSSKCFILYLYVIIRTI